MGKSFVINKNVNFSQVAIENVTLYDEIKISGKAFPSGSGKITGVGYYREGEVVTLSANPYADYRFSNWSDGNQTRVRNVLVGNTPASYNAMFEYYAWTQIVGTGRNFFGSSRGCNIVTESNLFKISIQNTIPRFQVLSGFNSLKPHFVQITHFANMETELGIGEVTTGHPTNIILPVSTTPKTDNIYIMPGEELEHPNIFGFLLAFSAAESEITITNLKILEVDV